MSNYNKIKSGVLESDPFEDEVKGEKKMALIKCKECGKDISETAENCPHCGERTACGRKAVEAKRLQLKKLFATILLLIGIVLIAGSGKRAIEYYADWRENWNSWRLHLHGDLRRYMEYYEVYDVFAKTTYGVLFLLGGIVGLYIAKPKTEEISGNRSYNEKQQKQAVPIPVRQAKAAPASGWKCADCGEINEEHLNTCQYCGSTKDFSVSQKK